MIFQFHKSTKNCTLVASQPLFFRASRHFAKDIVPLAETCSKPQKRWSFFLAKKFGTDGRKAQSLTQKKWGETGILGFSFLGIRLLFRVLLVVSLHPRISWESPTNLRQALFAALQEVFSKTLAARCRAMAMADTPPKKKTPPVCLEVRYIYI